MALNVKDKMNNEIKLHDNGGEEYVESSRVKRRTSESTADFGVTAGAAERGTVVEVDGVDDGGGGADQAKGFGEDDARGRRGWQPASTVDRGGGAIGTSASALLSPAAEVLHRRRRIQPIVFRQRHQLAFSDKTILFNSFQLKKIFIKVASLLQCFPFISTYQLWFYSAA